MHIDVVDTIFYYTQNLKSTEDLVSGALAAAFFYCPKFTNFLFNDLGINVPNKKNKNDYLIDTGYYINSNRYYWLKSKIESKIEFKPDIMISSYEDDWDENTMPKGEELILIESKLFCADLTQKQEANYQQFKKAFSNGNNNSVKMILISIKDYRLKEKPELFDKVVTWNEILDISEKIYFKLDEYESERIVLRELIDFMKLQIIPSVEDIFIDGKPCPNCILTELKQVIKSKEVRMNNKRIRVEDTQKLSEGCDDDFLSVILESYSKERIKKSDPFSYIKLSGKNESFYLNCSIINNNKAVFWIDYHETEGLLPLGKLKFDKNFWKNDWMIIADSAIREFHKLL